MENLQYNRLDAPPKSPVAAKICWNYGCGAMLWTHLSRWPHLAEILRLRKIASLAVSRAV
jgi:hypothetical protein